ncbi:DEAD/DEAH box helicase family protein [Motilimonas pumila]|uniref:DEAD/DEAH box helicase n=1 Tax=Motilimonas pumila TaxID=2303987 RepID=A0A418YIM9_9GAMM|nr:DEAD/DEAH box helicase family protein [Motilimonas pumila]RJG50511.1 DEAD/DEAH box helicase [Motilimonas pumila]
MPLSPLVIEDNLLTTGGNHPLLPQLIHAINHASEIEIAVSFIQPSGLDLLLPSLHEAIERHRATNQALKLKILTSDYLSITHPVALRSLADLDGENVEVRIFESKNHSFHMKSYIFVSGATEHTMFHGSAFIGSNNISKSALTQAHEWCLRLDYQAPENCYQAQQFHHIRAEFAAIFSHPNTVPLSDEWINDYIERRQPPSLTMLQHDGFVENDPYTPNTAQAEALLALANSRKEGYQRGLVVLGTGMGKTWLSAFDAKQMAAKKVLFVAHREEILSQALNTFAKLWPEKSSGYYHGKTKDKHKDMLFASVQTLGRSQHLKQFSADHFDYIVIDEFHHASAKTYRNILHYFTPKFLLGLTATPERSDQANILTLCHDNLVFERNLVHGIDEQILVPFHYYGIWDEFVNYEEIPWRNGRFDPSSLDAQFATQQRAKHIFKHWQQHQQTRTLAFCVSKKHADFMAQAFNQAFTQAGYRAVAIHSDSQILRNEALSMLDKGHINIIFSVDLFNEGTDLPAIDTILMLRPTESQIIFLQQLGRGLRLHQGKTHLVVIDFIGNHQAFLNKQELLAKQPGKQLTGLANQGQARPDLGAGCFVNLDVKVVDFWSQLAKKLRKSAQQEYQDLQAHLGHPPNATEFYRAGYDLNKVKKQHASWFGLVAAQCQDQHKQQVIQKHHDFLLAAVQTTAMTKSFKMLLLEAFIELDGLNNAPDIATLAAKSWHILASYPTLKQTELPTNVQHLTATDDAWVKYWLKNPIEHSIKSKKGSSQPPWFTLDTGHFKANFTIANNEVDTLQDLVKELVDYRIAKYIDTKQISPNQTEGVGPIEITEQTTTLLPYYPDLKIACGHFKAGRYEDVEMYSVPMANLDPNRHFLAHATGNSMNGGKSPILDGDLLLLELVSSTSAGAITGQTMAIEMQDSSGDDLYVLRDIEKDPQGQYQLRAKNPDYAVISANESMKPFARLKSVIKD